MTDYLDAVGALEASCRRMMGNNLAKAVSKDFTFIDTFAVALSLKYFSIHSYDVQVGKETFECYQIEEDSADRLVALALVDVDVFDLITHICMANIAFGEALPKGLRIFASSILEGRYKRPVPAHRSREKSFMMDLTIFQLINDAIILHNLKMTRNDTSPAISACDAVSDALANCNLDFSFTQLKAMCVSPRKKDVRNAVKIFLYGEHGSNAIFLGNHFEPPIKTVPAALELPKLPTSAT